jgi:hypothetical protein
MLHSGADWQALRDDAAKAAHANLMRNMDNPKNSTLGEHHSKMQLLQEA